MNYCARLRFKGEGWDIYILARLVGVLLVSGGDREMRRRGGWVS